MLPNGVWEIGVQAVAFETLDAAQDASFTRMRSVAGKKCGGRFREISVYRDYDHRAFDAKKFEWFFGQFVCEDPHRK